MENEHIDRISDDMLLRSYKQKIRDIVHILQAP